MKRFLFTIAFLISGCLCFAQVNWTLSNEGIPSGYLPNDFAIAPNGDIYLVCHQLINGSYYVPKMMKSENQGGDWEEVYMNGLGDLQSTTSIIFNDNKLLLAGGSYLVNETLIFYSNDFGENWSLCNIGIPEEYIPNDFAIAANGDVYLVCQQLVNGSYYVPKLLKSDNGGETWIEVFMNGIDNLQSTTAIVFKGNKLFISGANASKSSYLVYCSDDNGVNWTLSNNGIPVDYNPNDFALALNGDLFLVCDELVNYTFYPKLMKSTNDGNSWTEVSMTGFGDLQKANSILFSDGTLVISGGSYLTDECCVYTSDIYSTIDKNFKSVTVFPNPIKNEITIVIDPKLVSCDFTITDQYGKEQFVGNFSSIETKILLEDFVSGFYFLTIEGNPHLTKKLIKL